MVLAAMLLMLAAVATTNATTAKPQRGEVLQQVRFEQRLGSTLPLSATFQDESGRTVTLQQLLAGRPAVLVFAYYACPNLCGLTLQALARTVEKLPLRVGSDFSVIVVSISPKETPALALQSKRQLLRPFEQAADGWHLLTGEAATIEKVADTAGYGYAYDSQREEYAHASGVLVLAPDGRISRYLYGVRFAARDLRLALADAGRGEVGSLVDQVLLFCYGYDPTTGRYSLLVWKLLRAGGAGTVLILGGVIGTMLWRERSARRRKEERT